MSNKQKDTVEIIIDKFASEPKLRFPKFRNTEAWPTVQLDNCSVPVTERVGERVLTPISISAGIGFVPQAEKFGRDISGNQYSLYTHVRKGDFVFNKGNSLKYPQGCVYQLKNWDEVAAPNVFISFRFKTGYWPAFYEYCFEKNLHGQQLRKSITSGARSNGLLNISKDTFFSISLPYPHIEEQKKIADCLASVDELIVAQAQKVEALKAHKKGLMQLLFPAEGETLPKLRFPEFHNSPQWEKKPLGEIFSERIEKGHSDKAVLSATQDRGVIPYELLDKSVIRDRKNLAGYKLVRKGNFVISLRSFEGGFEYSNYEGIISPAYVMLEKKLEINNFFFQVMFKSSNFIKKIQKLLNNSLRDGKSISYNQAKEMELTIPSSPEQQKIGNCLFSVDELIMAQVHKLEVLKAHKKGLMQQLFPVTQAGE